MIDIVFPKGNEKDFVETAKRLGYSGLCLAYGEKDRAGLDRASQAQEKDFAVFTGIVCRKMPKTKAGLYLAEKSDRPFLKGNQDIIFNIEGTRDFIHQRESGLNHILCRMMQENDVAYGIPFSSILNSDRRPALLGQIMQNIRLCQKYRVNIAVASFASDPYDMRALADMEALARVLGIKNAKKSLKYISNLLRMKQRQIRKGIQRIK